MAEKSLNVVVVGAGLMDITIRCSQIPQAGQTVKGGGLSYCPTGSGVNQAIQAALCGCNVNFISKVGSDPFGKMIKENLESFGVITDFVYTAEAMNTGTAVTLVNSNGENAICASPGANRSLRSEDIKKAEGLFESAAVCLIHGQMPQDTIITAIRTAQVHGTKVIIDPARSTQQWNHAETDLPIEYFSANVLIPDLSEAEQITAEPAESIHTAKLLGSEIVGRGVENVIIKLDKRGCMLVSKDGSVRIPPFDVELVDQTCSGDAFAGALAAYCAVGDDMTEAVKFASAAGALACTKFGSQDSLPSKAEIIELLQTQGD